MATSPIHPIGTDSSLIKAASDYLGARGLSIEEAYGYGIQLLPAANIYRLLGWEHNINARHRGGLWCQHIDPAGVPYEGSGQAILFSGGGFGTTIKVDKYNPRANVNPWFSPIPGGWVSLPDDTLVVVCESVVKACVVRKVLGTPTVGLNGVDGWSLGRGEPHRDLSIEMWSRFRALVLYDSLSLINPTSAANVRRARDTVEELLGGFGNARLIRTSLPDAPPEFEDGQWGVDDFVVARGPDALRELVAEAEVVPIEESSRVLFKMAFMNRQYGVLKKPVRVVSLEDPTQLWSFNDFSNYYKNENVRTIGARGRITLQAVTERWYAYENRRNILKLDFLPGQPRLLDDEMTLNLWQGFGVGGQGFGRAEELWYSTIVEALGEAEGNLLVNFLAALVQDPSRKIGYYTYIYGRPGTGKNFMMEPLKAIFGRHHIQMSVEGYLNKFNTSLAAARIIVFPEMVEALDHKMADAFEAELKLEADTAPHHRAVEPKGAEKVYVSRHANVFMFSNYHPPFKTRRGDRRGLFFEMSDDMRPVGLGGEKSVEYWEERWSWMMDKGPSEIFAWLRDAWIVEEELLPSIAPMTEYKTRLLGADSVVGDLEAVLEEFIVSPPPELEGVLHMRAMDLIGLAYGRGPEMMDGRLTRSAGKKLQLRAGVNSVRVRLRGTDKVRMAILPGGSMDINKIEESMSKWTSYWAMWA
jgi:hypothetical protein